MQSTIKHKPEWLRKKITPSLNKELESIFAHNSLNTVCQEAMCPNISECFAKRQATFLIMGNRCTRQCTFCAVDKKTPLPLDANEPKKIADAIMELGLKHVVITSPTRDDLKDGGAEHFCKTVDVIKKTDDSITVELLIPDMKENIDALKAVANSGADIIAHNLETVPRLYNIRKGALYNRSLNVLKILKEFNQSLKTKSGIMLGLGEERHEIIELMQELLDAESKYLSIGQYLQPTPKHENIVKYIQPNEFELLRKIGMKMGFKYIKSSPYTRSSYMAHEYIK